MLTEYEKLAILFAIKFAIDSIHQIISTPNIDHHLRIMSSYLELQGNRFGRIWMHVRAGKYWETDVMSYNDAQWIENFRITKETFTSLVHLVYDDMKPDDVTVREPISAEKRTAIGIYALASSAEYRTIAHTFGVSKSSVCNCVKRHYKAVAPIYFLAKFGEAKEIAARIEREHHFPQVIGCIDGTHIPIAAPSEGKKDYTNRKGWDSIILQAVVDDKFMFRDINVKWPGSTHDAAVFAESGLFKHFDKLPKAPIILNGQQLPLLLLGDPAYPLLPWLVKPFIGQGIAPEKESFNVYHSSVRICVENAFGRLKARWRILGRKIGTSVDTIPELVSTCCALHNLCERNSIAIPHHTGPVSAYQQPPTNAIPQTDLHHEGHNVRQAIVEHLNSTQSLRRSFRI